MIHTVYNVFSKVQGVYTLVTAVWAIIHINSFMLVTGRKTDIWLVKTVAVVLIPIGLCFLFASKIKQDHWVIILVGITSSFGLAFIDFYYTRKGTISAIYAIDGILQTIFFLIWLALLRVHRRLSRRW